MSITAVNINNQILMEKAGNSIIADSVHHAAHKAETASDSVSGNISLLSGFLNGAGADGVITMKELSAAADYYKTKSQQRLREIIKEEDIDPNVSFSLSVNNQGKIIVDGDFEDREKLQTALNEDNAFNQSFKGYSAVSTLLAAAEEHEKFAEAYKEDPIAAVEKYRQNLNGNVTYQSKMNYNSGVMTSQVKQRIMGYSFS